MKVAPVRVVLAGFGAVGLQLAERLLRGDLPGAVLTGISARDLDKARRTLQTLASDDVRTSDAASAAVSAAVSEVVVVPLDALMEHADVVIECATAEAFPEIARIAMRAGKILIAVSVAGLPGCPEVSDLAVQYGGRIRVASGGLPGLDAIRAVCEGEITRIKLTTTFRPESLAHEPFVIDRGFDFSVAPAAPVKVFEGTARDAAAAFPRHFNVAITLSLGGIGFDRTEIEVWVDGAVRGAVQHIEVEADDADLTLISRNRPSSNPRTSRIVAPSIMAALRSYIEPIHVGT